MKFNEIHCEYSRMSFSFPRARHVCVLPQHMEPEGPTEAFDDNSTPSESASLARAHQGRLRHLHKHIFTKEKKRI